MPELQRDYFLYLYNLVCNDDYSNLTYHKLFEKLHSIPFTYTIALDSNRASAGVELRYQFGIDNNVPVLLIKDYIDISPVSVLEVIIALSLDIEQKIMDDTSYGNRIGQWFWNMIVSLGLGMQHDAMYDESYIEDVIFRFLNRQYQYNGEGGLFTLVNPHRDLRQVEIWWQAMWYLNEFIDGINE